MNENAVCIPFMPSFYKLSQRFSSRLSLNLLLNLSLNLPLDRFGIAEVGMDFLEANRLIQMHGLIGVFRVYA